MRFFKPLLAAAAVLSIAAPAASALADPYWGAPDYAHPESQRFAPAYDRPHAFEGDYWRDREAARERVAWRYHMWREHERWEHRHYGWRY
jgi:hypothetical protein